jgi:hypothetical protein
MVREEKEGGHIRKRGIIISSERGSGIGQVIIKVLIDFLDLLNLLSILSIFISFSDKAHPKTRPQLTNYQALMPVV